MSGLGVVTIAHGRHDHLRTQHLSLARGSVRPDVYVVVAMGDPALDSWPDLDGLPATVVPVGLRADGLPLATARNRGLDLVAAAGCDVLVGLDVDCLAGPSLVAGYGDAVRQEPQLVWAGPVTYLPPPPADGYPLDNLDALDDPHPARPAPPAGHRLRGGDPDLFWSLSFALGVRRWLESGGFCEAYVGYGGEDTDFARQLAQRGIEIGWDGSARAYHQHHPTSTPPVGHLDDILRNGRTFRERWGEWPMRGWLEEFERAGLIRRRGDDYERAG